MSSVCVEDLSLSLSPRRHYHHLLLRTVIVFAEINVLFSAQFFALKSKSDSGSTISRCCCCCFPREENKKSGEKKDRREKFTQRHIRESVSEQVFEQASKRSKILSCCCCSTCLIDDAREMIREGEGEGEEEGEGQLQLMTKIPYSLSFIFSSIDQRQSVSHTVVHLSRSMSLLLLERDWSSLARGVLSLSRICWHIIIIINWSSQLLLLLPLTASSMTSLTVI